jgi:hypothetical protein
LLTKAISLSNTPALVWEFDGLEARGDGAYARFKTSPERTSGSALALSYTLFKTEDATHRLLVAGRINGKDLLLTLSPTQTQSTVLRDAIEGAEATAPSSTTTASAATGTTGPSHIQPNSAWRSLTQYFLLGVHHLLEGYDHMAFLLALVLPLHLRLWPRPPGKYSAIDPIRTQRTEWGSLLRTIAAFTLGHLITLILATLGYTSASATWVEPAIAASIGMSALLNIYPQN